MGLLMLQLSKDFYKVADTVYTRQFEIDHKLESEYGEYRRKKMYEDILYNLSFLDIAERLDDELLFKNYAIWLYQLMVRLMKDLTPSRVKEQMIVHYTLLKEALRNVFDEALYLSYEKHLNIAIEATKSASDSIQDTAFSHGTFYEARSIYLNLLMNGDAKAAITYIQGLYHQGYAIDDIFVEVLQEVMKEIGNLWHQAKVSVEQEHYMTSVTQIAISQFYSLIFETKRNGLKLLSCTVGSELHEMGSRMVSDLFENHGWEGIYLGAALPASQILNGIKRHNPDLVALSVTMPQHLIECKTIVELIRKEYPTVKIAVGGRAFQMTDAVWKKWNVDYCSKDAKEFIDWANAHFPRR